jgi:hypothetical protein
MRTRFVGFSSVISDNVATGIQYRRKSSPHGVPGPTSVNLLFSSCESIVLVLGTMLDR